MQISPPVKIPWFVAYWAIFSGELLAISAFTVAIPIIPFYLEEMGVTDPVSLNFWNGMIQSGTALSLMVFAPVWGALGDFFGRKLMLLRAMFAGAFILSLMSLCVAPWQLMALRTLMGVFTGTVVAANVLTACIVPEKDVGFYLGLTQTAIFLGNSLGPMLGGFCFDMFGVRPVFVISGVLLAVAGCIILFFTYEVLPQRNGRKLSGTDFFPNLKHIKTNTVLFALLVISFFLQFSVSLVGPIIPLYVKSMSENLEMVGRLSGTVIGVSAVSGAIASVLIGFVSGKIGYSRSIILCLAGSALSIFPQGLVSSPYALIGLRFVSGFFLGGLLPSVSALLAARSLPGNKSSVFGLNSLFSSAGFAIGPMAGAAMVSFLGYGSVFFANAAALTVMCVSISFLANRVSGLKPQKSEIIHPSDTEVPL